MTYKIELKNAVKGYTYDQDKIISPEKPWRCSNKKPPKPGWIF